MTDEQNVATIRIGALLYRVERDAEIVKRNLDGEIVHSEGIIRLRPGMTPEYEYMIVWHEVLHAILTHMGLDQLLCEREEEFVKILAYGIASAVAENRLLQRGTV